ncbi:hypothetical protein GN956_G5147 [Arapaima gigas]
MNEDVKEHLRRITNRDLVYTYFYATAPKLVGAADGRRRAMGGPPGTRSPALHAPSAGAGEGSAEDKVRDYRDWLRERKALRRALATMGDLARWMDGKPALSELECSVLEREKKSKNRNGPEPTDRCSIPRSPAQAPGQADLSVLAMTQGVRPLPLPGAKCDEKPLFSQETDEKHMIHQHRKKGALTNTHVVTLGNPAHQSHCLPSTLGGYSSGAVDEYRQQSLREHLGVVEKFQAQGIVVNQAMLERGLLHPGDRDLSSCLRLRQPGGWLSRSSGEQKAGTEEKKRTTELKFHKNGMKRCPHVDFNAFWPGHEDHVRLYLPQVGIPSQHVLFHHIRHNPVPSPACWPINEKGYYTSGNIDGNKTYTLF